MDAVRTAAYYCSMVYMPIILSLMFSVVWSVPVDRALSIGAAVSAATCVYAAWSWRRERRYKRRLAGMRRCDDLLDRVHGLIQSIPCRTEAETLAALHEIRNCYNEAIELEDRLGDGGGMIAARLRENLGCIDDLYGIQTGSLRRTEANAADFAAAMRRLGRDADGAARGVR